MSRQRTPVSASWPTRRLACPSPVRDVIRAGRYRATRAYDVPRDVIRAGCPSSHLRMTSPGRLLLALDRGRAPHACPGFRTRSRDSTGCPHGVHAVRRDRARRVGARGARPARAPQRGGAERAGAAGQRGLRHGHPRDQHRACARVRRARPRRSPDRRRGRWARPRLHDARGARRLPRREVRRGRDRAGPGRLDARRHRPARSRAAGRPAGHCRGGRRGGRARRGPARVVRPDPARRRQRPRLPRPRGERRPLPRPLPRRRPRRAAPGRGAGHLVGQPGTGAGGRRCARCSARPRHARTTCCCRTATSTTGSTSRGSDDQPGWPGRRAPRARRGRTAASRPGPRDRAAGPRGGSAPGCCAAGPRPARQSVGR